MSRRGIMLGVVIGLAMVGAGGIVATGFGSTGDAASGSPPRTDATPSFTTATVRRGILSSEREFDASVHYGDPWTINRTATGTITDSHEIGTVVGFNEPLIRIDNRPVTLARGAMPMYRELHRVDTGGRDEHGNRLELQTGPDVRQLQTFLLVQGFDDDGKLEVDGEFGRVTERAVKDWQEVSGLPVSGRVDSSQIVFEPEPVRVNSATRVGDGFSGIEVTGSDAKVLVDTSTRDRSAIPVGSTVDIDIDGIFARAGTVTEQKQVTGENGSRIWRTTIAADSDLPEDASTVTVTALQTIADDVLLVPVAALLALSEGGFAVEVPDGSTTTLIRVEVGEVLDGTAEIDGDIDEGDVVVVPT